MCTLRVLESKNERTAEIDEVLIRNSGSPKTFCVREERRERERERERGERNEARVGCCKTAIRLFIGMGNAATRTARATRAARSGKHVGSSPSLGDVVGEVAVPTPRESLRATVELPQGDDLNKLVSMITSRTRRFADSAEVERRVPSRATNVQRKKNRLETKDIRRLLAAGGACQSGEPGEPGEPGVGHESLKLMYEFHEIDSSAR